MKQYSNSEKHEKLKNPQDDFKEKARPRAREIDDQPQKSHIPRKKTHVTRKGKILPDEG